MALEDTTPGGTPAGADTPTQAATPAAATPPDFTKALADMQASMQASMAKALADQQAAFEAKLASLRPTPAPAKKPKEEVAHPVAEPTPLLIKPLEEDPAYQALLTAQKERDVKLVEIEKALAQERGAREKAEEAAREQERFSAVFSALTDLDNPVRTDPDGGQMAAKWLLSQAKVQRSKQTGGYFVADKDPQTGEDKTIPLKEFVQNWLGTKEGARFRPALPPGAGTYAGSPGATLPGGQRKPINDREAISSAMAADMQRLAQLRGGSPN